MNPDPPTKHSGALDLKVAPRGDESGWLRELFGRGRGPRAARSYPDAVAGSSDPTRRRRALGEGGPGVVRRWRAEDGELHRSKKTAGPGAVLVAVET